MIDVLTYFPAGPGQVAVFDDGRKFISAYWDGSTPATLVTGTPFVVGFDATYGRKLIVPATLAIYQMVGGLHLLRTDAGYVWVQYEGRDDDALVNGNSVDVTAGHYVQVINTGTYLIEAAAGKETESVALAIDAQGGVSTVASSVYWLGERVYIAASA